MTPTPASARLKRMLLATSLLGLSAPALARAAPVLPTGGKVVSGTAAIGAAGAGGLTITQSSNKAIINWSGFSIGQGGKVQFDNGKGATLNRVTGGSVSAIDGLLGATGSVYVINPNGVIIGKTGVVNVGGTFVASTLDVSDADFLSGGALGFSGPSAASVINLGKVGALGGDVALIGAVVENDGAISAANGSAGLIAGHSVVMLRDASLDEGRFSVLLGGAGTSATNVGVIQAAAAELRAEGGNVYALAGDTSGVIRATGVKSGGGKIWLTAEGGTAQVDGTLEAQGPRGTPGAIETSAGVVALAPKVDIDSHGGTWLLDPYDVTISTAPDTAGSPGSAPTQTTNVNTTTLDNALADNSVVISTGAAGGAGSDAGNITVAAPVAWSSGASLTLTAANAIAVNAPITIGGAGQLALNTGMVAVGSSTQPLLSFAQGAAVSFTGTEDSGQALSINGTGYALVYSMAELAALNNTSGDDALAVSLTPATTYTSSVIDTFSGTLEGLGHTITGLTINDSGGYEVGLVGNLTRSATVRDLGLLGVDISGSQVVGGLAGFNEGTISQSYVTGVVGGTENFDGGLVADNTGTIAQSYANVAVSGTNTAGGLVGQNGATIVASYASGPVVGSEGEIGGLVGENGGSITQSYATGAVGGSSGGLVGENDGTITTSYFDTQTTGQSSGVGFQQPGGGTPTGLTTAQFQSGSASGLGSAFAGGIGGLYPYLANFFPNGVQAVSGVAYSDAAGTAPLASTSAGAVTVSLDGGGAQIGQASTGANGYYYVAVPAGTLASGEAVLASTPAVTATGATDSATLALSTGAGAQAGLNLYPSTLTIQTAQTLLSTSPTLATAIAAAGADGGAAAVVNGTTGIGYDALGSSFTIDQAVSTSGGFSVATGSGDPLTVGAPITLGSGGALSLLSGGALAVDAPISVDGSAPVTLAYDASSPTNLSFAQGSAPTFANADGSAATAPVTGQSLTVNGTAYTLVYTLAELNGIDAANNGTGAVQYGAGLAGDYALASSLVLAGTTYTQAPIASVGGTTFSGILEGLGHTLTGLTVSASGADSVGLIGTLFGAVRDLGLLNGTVIGKYDVGALAGGNYGTIVQTYATGAVSGTNQVGGLVGLNGGAITQAYATGAVSGQGNVGGLAGENAGTITQAYATGAVSGGGDVGGLVGANTGAIAQAYATGAVSGSNGGLVGGNFGGTLADGYYDIQTTGQTSDGGGATGLTTAQLQGTGTPTGFSLGSSFSGGVAGGRA
uniref:beta strand repeat-containing protein n=1 Tax=Caulobacter sp. S45 TaxID=1641861 RepID=UPI0015751432